MSLRVASEVSWSEELDACRNGVFLTLRRVPFRSGSSHPEPAGSGLMTDEMRAAEVSYGSGPLRARRPDPRTSCPERESMAGVGRREGAPRVHALAPARVRLRRAGHRRRVTTSRPGVTIRITSSARAGQQRVAAPASMPARSRPTRGGVDLGYATTGSVPLGRRSCHRRFVDRFTADDVPTDGEFRDSDGSVQLQIVAKSDRQLTLRVRDPARRVRHARGSPAGDRCARSEASPWSNRGRGW